MSEMKMKKVRYTRLGKVWTRRPCCVCGEMMEHQEVLYTEDSEIAPHATVMKDADGVDRCMFPENHPCSAFDAWKIMTQPYWGNKDARAELRKHWLKNMKIILPEIPPRTPIVHGNAPRTPEEAFSRIESVSVDETLH